MAWPANTPASWGALTAESRLGEGSTFFLEFPKKEAPNTFISAHEQQPTGENSSLQRPPKRSAEGPGGSWGEVKGPGEVATRKQPAGEPSAPLRGDREGPSSPSHRPPKQREVGASPPPLEGVGGRLLLVEDNNDMRLFLQDILSPPYQVLTASNGAHALEQLENLAPGPLPELIVTDIMMPEMDGFTLIRRLKASPEWQGIPIIALTARAGLDDRLAALRIGVDDYLAKPFEPAELLARTTNLLHNYRRRREWLAAQITSFSPGAGQPDEIIAAGQQWLAELETIALGNIEKPDFTVNELAQLLHMSSRHLRRKLKQLTGLPPADYLREIRLQRARRLLENRACHNVAEASYAVGISTPRHFSRLFKARFGKAPSSYF